MSSSRSEQRAPRTRNSEAGGSRSQSSVPSTSRPSAANKGGAPPPKRMVLSRDDLRAAVTKKRGEAKDAPAEKPAEKLAKKTIAPKVADAPVKEKRKRALEDRSPSPPAKSRPPCREEDKGKGTTTESPEVETLLTFPSPSQPTVTDTKVAVDLFEQSCLPRDLCSLSAQGLPLVMDDFASCWAKVKKLLLFLLFSADTCEFS